MVGKGTIVKVLFISTWASFRRFIYRVVKTT